MKWLVGGPDTKEQILIDGKGCLRCMALWHKTGSSKCKAENRKCDIDGCKGPEGAEAVMGHIDSYSPKLKTGR